MKTIHIVYKRSSDYESQQENIKAFESKTRAEEYIERLEKLFPKAYEFYDELAGHPSTEQVMAMPDDVYDIYDVYSTKRNRFYGYVFGIEELPVFDMTIKMSIDFNRAIRNLENMTPEEHKEMMDSIISDEQITPEQEAEDYLMYRIDASLIGGGQIAYYYDGIVSLERDRLPVYKTKNPNFNQIVFDNLNTLGWIANEKENPCELIDTLIASTMLLLEKC